ncbi:MAG: hypothetical protein HFH34_14380 [Eubacterium sp.]|nr:hypothetical protein [Eubacterium sp.]
MNNDHHNILKLYEKETQRFPPDEARKAESLRVIQQAVFQKRMQRRPSFAENVWNQLRFQTWQHWAAQGSVLLFAMIFVLRIQNLCESLPNSIAACSVFLVFAGNICLSSIARLFSRHMAELEKTLYLDLKQMVCIHMLEAGIFDLLVLGILAGFSASRLHTGFFAYVIYLLVPFLWSEIFYLHMLTHARCAISSFRQLSAAACCGILALFPSFWKNAYLPETIPVWILLSAAGCFLLAAEIRSVFSSIDTGDRLCQQN